jgi:predicted Zn-dependent peptidase
MWQQRLYCPGLKRTSSTTQKKTRSRFASSNAPGVAPHYLRPEEIAPVDVRTEIFPNGLTVVSERVLGSASLAAGLWVKVGSRHEARTVAGIAHFIEHVVFKGTAGRSMREIMRSIESRGGYLNAFTTKEHTCYYTWTRTAHLAEAVSVLFDLALRPSFSAKDIEREKAVVIEEINGLEDEPDEMVFDLFEQKIFGDHPLARPIIGGERSISRLTRDRLIDFHRRHYQAPDILLVASGSHQHVDLFEAVRHSMKDFPAHAIRRSATPASLPRHKAVEHHEERAAGQQSHIILGRRAPGIHSRDQVAISALITLLGVGMSSRLNLRLREELGLAYDATAFYTPYADAGAVGVYIATAVENRDRAVKEMRKIVKGLFTRPVSAVELERTKEQLIGSLVLPLESVSNRMMRSAQNQLYHDRYIPVEQDIEKIGRVTLAEVRGLAEKLFYDERGLSLVSIVPQSAEA